METMKAIRMHSYGGAEVLVYEDAPRPEPQPGEVLVQVYAAAINGIDWKIRDGELQKLFNFQLPTILGSDAAGVVAAVGADVTTLEVGQEVYGMTIAQSLWFICRVCDRQIKRYCAQTQIA